MALQVSPTPTPRGYYSLQGVVSRIGFRAGALLSSKGLRAHAASLVCSSKKSFTNEDEFFAAVRGGATHGA